MMTPILGFLEDKRQRKSPACENPQIHIRCKERRVAAHSFEILKILIQTQKKHRT